MEKIRLGDACEILNGYAFKSENYVASGIRVIRIANVQKGFIEDNTPAFYPFDSSGLEKYMLKEDDLLMSLTGNVGRVAILEKKFLPAALNQRVACLRLKTDRLTKGYLFHILNSDFFEQQCIQSSKGVAQKNMSTEWLKDYEIPVYPKEKQAEITSILDKTRNIIACRNQELQKLDELIKARFVEMFGDPITNLKGYTKLTVAEAIEAGFIEKPFDGNHGSKHPKSSEYVAAGIPFLMANNVIDGTVDQTNCSFITEERANRLDKGFARDNDVLITHKGTIGRTAVLRTDYDFVMLTPQVAAYRIIKGITPDYLCGYFATEFFQNEMKILAAAGGSTRAYAGITAQLQLHIIIPPLDEQYIYTDFIKHLDKSKVAVQKALDEAQLLFDSLMQKYFG